MLLLALSVLISCTTTELPNDDNSYYAILVDMIPPLPSIPSFPELSWKFKDGRYSIDEADADKLLDYGENKLPLYRYQMDVYRKSMDRIIKGLKKEEQVFQ